MGKNLFAWLGVLLILLSMVHTLHAEPPYKFVTEMTCGDTNLFVFTYCLVDEDSPKCYQQHIVFENNGYVSTVNATGSPNYHRDTKTGEMAFDALDGLARVWACVHGKDKQYVVIRTSNGGNCRTCEWYEIYGLDGKLYTPDPRKRKGGFDKIYRSLGLPKQLPMDLFENIGVHDRDFE